MKRTIFAFAAMVAVALPATADTLYVAGPPPAAPGHPMRLGADHRAAQVGDLVAVAFNFSTSASRAYNSATAKGYSVNQGAGGGILNVPLLRFGANATGSTASNASDQKTDASTFSSTMTATVTNILPSGALELSGDQVLYINGEKQTLHVTGTARYEDIDNTDTIPSTRLANVQAKFAGNDAPADHKGILRKIMDALF
jgi:flagellar L-ring protein precursor FlgH